MNNYKSQGRTLEEVYARQAERIDAMNEAIENGQTKVISSDIPDPIRNHTVMLDLPQLYSASGEDCDKLMKSLRELSKEHDLFFCDEVGLIDTDRVNFDILKGRSPTGRYVHEWRPSQHPLPVTEKAYDWLEREEKVEEKPKHPMIFKISDLVEDDEEFPRLRATLERNRAVEEQLGWPAPPMFIEAIQDSNTLAHVVSDVMSQLTALAREYKVEIYFGTKTALKTALYSLMYGAKKSDLDMSKIDEISVEKAIEMYNESRRKVAIIGGNGLGFGKMAKLLSDYYSTETVCVDSFDTWNFKDFANVAKLDKPVRDWEQFKLRRGKGHNKLKRKGKK